MRRCTRCRIRRAPDEYWPSARVCIPCLAAWRQRLAAGGEIAYRWTRADRTKPATPATRRL